MVETARTIASLPLGEQAGSAEPIPEIPGYEIEGELGRGGMGVVYQALQTALKRRVALKMILAGQAQEERQRFMSEANAVAQLKHPNIVQIYEIGEAEGRPFFSLELVDGGSLEDRFGGKPMAWRQAAELISLVARAIHVAHLQGIVHRDLKPANILLQLDGTPKITDFGIAKRLDSSHETQAGKILGSPAYMSPEQALGKNDSIGPATDIYALGAMLYDALTGRPPFETDNTIDTILQAVRLEAVPPRTLQPSVPRDLDVICLKCLEKKPERRYATALELAEDLKRLLRNEPISARPISSLERAQRWAARNPAWATLAVALVLSVLALFATGAWFTRQLQRELRATEQARKQATDARNELRSRLAHSIAERVDSDLRQLAGVPKVLAHGLEQRSDWTAAQLQAWLFAELDRDPHIFGMAIAFETWQFRSDVQDFALYVHRDAKGIQAKQLLPPEYTPIYREWDWYKRAERSGTWSEPYVDEGGGEIPMATFTMPFERQGKRVGVVTVDLSLEYFEALQHAMQDARMGGKSYALVTTGKGTFVSHPDAGRRFPAPGSHSPFRSDANQAALWSRILGGELGRERGRDPVSGKPAELLFAPVRSGRWSCVFVVPD
ncbi:MAG TPA: protein kinase [Polyangiaceae bacterium]